MADEAPTPKPRSAVINIEHLADTVMFHAPDATIALCPDGHSGSGYYVWSNEYSEEGSSFLCGDAPTVCRIAAKLADRLADAEQVASITVAKT